MKRFIAILLSLLIVGIPSAFWLYREHQHQVQMEIEAAIRAEEERLALQVARENSARMLLDDKDKTFEEARTKAEELLEERRKNSPGGIDFIYWKAQNPRIVGYLRSPGTVISYPVIQGTDNDFYLDHDIYGNYDINGCIMLEHLNQSDFSDNNSIIYGHHMKAGTMLASLDRYKDASFYADHSYMFLYTPEHAYRLDLIAGYPCPHDDDVFRTVLSDELIAQFKAKSTFKTDLTDTSGPYVTLCTCSYEHDNWRYVVICKKVTLW